MQEVLNWFYTFMSNQVTWLFSMQIVQGVSLGMLLVLALMSGLCARYIVLKAGI